MWQLSVSTQRNRLNSVMRENAWAVSPFAITGTQDAINVTAFLSPGSVIKNI